MSEPIVTIVVVTYNSLRWLGRQRAALEAQTERRWRLVVIDNASGYEQRPQASTLPDGAVLIHNAHNLGFAEANNIGARSATTKYLVFLNPDAFPTSDWLAQLIAVAERHPRSAAVGSTQIRADAEDVFDGTGDVLHASGLAYRSSFGAVRRTAPEFGETFSACAAAMLVRRDAFEEVGGFDPSYFCYYEDIDLCFRFRLRGWCVLQSPDAVVAHVGGGAANNARGFAEFHGARNRLWTFAKCMPAALFWPLLPLHILASSAAATGSWLKGRGWAAWHGFLVGLAHLDDAWRQRAAIQRGRTARTREIARMLAWSPHVFIGRRPVIRPVPPGA